MAILTHASVVSGKASKSLTLGVSGQLTVERKVPSTCRIALSSPREGAALWSMWTLS
jgi:hypothetical protein